MKLSNMSAVVTGASTGIGREIAKIMAANGTTVALVGRSMPGLTETTRLIQTNGGTSEVFQVDLRDCTAIERLARTLNTNWNGVDIIVHAAGVWHNGNVVYAGLPLADTPAEQIDEVLDVGIRAPMLLTHHLLPPMIQKRRGKILSISGTFASGGAGWLHYYVSKLALEHFTVGLAQELRAYEIQVNCISPSDTKTDALKRFFPDDAATALEPVEVAKLALFLLSEEAQHVTGQCIVIKNKAVH